MERLRCWKVDKARFMEVASARGDFKLQHVYSLTSVRVESRGASRLLCPLHTSADSPLPALPFVLAAFGITFSEKSTCLTP